MADLLSIIGSQHEIWLRDLWKEHKIVQEPIVAPDGEMVAEPVFWLQSSETRLRLFWCPICWRQH